MNGPAPAAPVPAAAGNRAKVFVSYSRKDMAFAQMMVDGAGRARLRRLSRQGRYRAGRAVEGASRRPHRHRRHGGVRVSPDSVASPICAWELEEGARLGKRIIPVVTRRIADADAPPALGRLNYVFLTESDDKDAALSTLDTALRTDLPWVREHTRLGELARHWDEERRSNSATLARRRSRGRRALARPPPGRRQCADRTAPGIHPGRAGGRRRHGSAIGSAARSPSPPSPSRSRCSPKSAGNRRRRSASAPSTP